MAFTSGCQKDATNEKTHKRLKKQKQLRRKTVL